MERDPAGNLWARAGHAGPVVGGRLAPGLACARAGASTARSASPPRSRSPSTLPIAVISFADEEGARFNTPTFGSRALVGRLDVDDALDRVDDHGVTLGDAMADAGVDPDGLRRRAGVAGAAARLPRAAHRPDARRRGLVRARRRRDAAGRAAAAAGRARRPRRPRRHDAARGAPRRARRRRAADRARRREAAAAARAWSSPRRGSRSSRTRRPPCPRARGCGSTRAAPEPEAVESWRDAVTAEAERVADEAGVGLDLRTAAWSPGTEFPLDVRQALLIGLRPPSRASSAYAGHDAGVIASRPPGRDGARPQRDRHQPRARGVGRRSTTPRSAATALLEGRWRSSREARSRSRRWPTCTRTRSSATCAGVGERSGPTADDDFWSWREAHVRAGRAARPGRACARSPRASTRRWRRRATAPSASSTTSTTSPTATPYEDPNAMAIAVAEAARRPGLRVVLLPAAYHRAGGRRPGALPRPDGRGVPRARRRPAAGRAGSRVGVAAHSVRAVPADWLRGDRGVRRPRTASSATSTRTSSRASWPSARPSTAARRSSCSIARASSARGRRSCTPST